MALVGPEMDEWLNSWSAEDHEKYNGQYVAVSVERKVVAADPSASRLQRKLRELGLRKVRVFLHEPYARIIYSIHPSLGGTRAA
ncbi:MAG: DUF5678 domain-containing protein [Dehalococcoidia bacterium]